MRKEKKIRVSVADFVFQKHGKFLKSFTRAISSNINECDMPNSFSGRSGSKIIHHFITNT